MHKGAICANKHRIYPIPFQDQASFAGPLSIVILVIWAML